MYRPAGRPQRSPGVPRPAGRFPSPSSGWAFAGPPSPYGGSPRGCPPFSPHSQGFSPGYRDRSPAGFGNGSQSFGSSPAGFDSRSSSFGTSPTGLDGRSRGYGGQRWRQRDGFRRPQSFSPNSAPKHQRSSDVAVEKYFSPSMIQDPWKDLQPVTAAAARKTP